MSRPELSKDLRTVIDGDSFAAALTDERTRKLQEDAMAYLTQLQAEGRDHSLPERLTGLLHQVCPHCGKPVL